MKQEVHRSKTVRSIRYLLNQVVARYTYSQSNVCAQVRGVRFVVFANDYIGVQINQFGVYEREELSVIFDFLAPVLKDICKESALDIGANIGNHSVYFSRLFSSVYSFEPNPSTFEILSINTRHVSGVKIFNFGLGDKKGIFDLIDNPTNAGGASIKHNSGDADLSHKINVQRIDDFDFQGDRIGLMKVDVEGFEKNVFLGSSSTIKRHEPIVIFEQHESEFSKDGTSPTIEVLKSYGYKVCFHQNGSASKNSFVRLFFNFKEIFFGRTHRIIFSDLIVPNTYPLLIGIPPRFFSSFRL